MHVFDQSAGKQTGGQAGREIDLWNIWEVSCVLLDPTDYSSQWKTIHMFLLQYASNFYTFTILTFNESAIL